MSSRPDVDAVRHAAATHGLCVDVEIDGALAVLRPSSLDAARRLAIPSVRTDIVRAARAAGFTHVAVELPADASPT